MKKILFIMAAIMLVVATGCKKEDKKKDLKAITVGEWHCVPEGMDADIYVAFAAEGGFDLYQQIGEGRHRHYTGTWTLEETSFQASMQMRLPGAVRTRWSSAMTTP